jgi:ferredoxin
MKVILGMSLRGLSLSHEIYYHLDYTLACVCRPERGERVMGDSEAPPGKRVRIRVVVERCVGHARCAAVAPDVYVLDDEGYNRTAEKVVGTEHRASAIRGKRACPERIISVEDIP